MVSWERFFRSAGVILLLVFLFSLGQAALPFPIQVYADAQGSNCGDGVCDLYEPDTCLDDCSPTVTCGDGVCSAFEDYQNCFLDCLPPSSTPTSTPTPTLTTIPPSPTATAPPVDPVTNTPSPEPSLASSTPTMWPTVMLLANNSTPEPTSMPVSLCREVAIEEISKETTAAFMAAAEGTLTDRWVICDTPPKKMCLPSAPSLGDLAAVHLLDCHVIGQCDVYNTIRLKGGQVCVDLENVEQAPDCSEGCVWAVMEQDKTPMNLPSSVFLGLILFGLMGLIVILHVVYPVQADDESNSSANTLSP